jgi:hypothetical protein
MVGLSYRESASQCGKKPGNIRNAVLARVPDDVRGRHRGGDPRNLSPDAGRWPDRFPSLVRRSISRTQRSCTCASPIVNLDVTDRRWSGGRRQQQDRTVQPRRSSTQVRPPSSRLPAPVRRTGPFETCGRKSVTGARDACTMTDPAEAQRAKNLALRSWLIASGAYDFSALCSLRRDTDPAATSEWIQGQGTSMLVLETPEGVRYPAFQFTERGALKTDLSVHIKELQETGWVPGRRGRGSSCRRPCFRARCRLSF